MFTVIGIITTVVFAKVALRVARHRFGSRWHDGGSCGASRRHARRHEPFDLRDIGTNDYDEYRGLDRVHMRRSTAPMHGELRIKTVFQGLELNARQQSETDDVLAVLRNARVAQLSLALRACARPTFDADLAAAAVGPHASTETLDALEHLHTILTEEQRAALERLTART